MYKIVSKKILNPALGLMEIHAPFVARKCEAGQFIILRVDEDGERIPLTIADFDRDKETVTIGPLGVPSPLKYTDKKIIGVAGGLGAAPIYPQLKKLAEMGVKVDVILGGRSKEFVILEEQFREFCDNIYVCTDDGSYGEKGFVTVVLQELLDKGEEYEECIAIGSLGMMNGVVNVTKPAGLHTMVSLNPLMIDGTGMCGCCRVTVDGEMKFACVDGPDFDGFKVDFKECMERQNFFKDKEKEMNDHACKIGRG